MLLQKRPGRGLELDTGWVPQVTEPKFNQGHEFVSYSEQKLSHLCLPSRLFSLYTPPRSVNYSDCTATTYEALSHGNHTQASRGHGLTGQFGGENKTNT